MLYVPVLKLSLFVALYKYLCINYLFEAFVGYEDIVSWIGGVLFFILLVYLNHNLEKEENSKMFGTLYTNENGEVVASEIYRRQQEDRH